MSKTLDVRLESWPIKGSFRIARGAKTAADVVVAEIADPQATGRGECVPYPRYGETPASVIEQIETMRSAIAAGLTREELQLRLPPGAARNALDCAMLDWEAKATGRSAAKCLGVPPPRSVRTVFTLSLDTPEAMALAAKDASDTYRVLKVKVGAAGDLKRLEAIRQAAPGAQLVVDANEGWTAKDLDRLLPVLAELGVKLIEQPLKQGEDDRLLGLQSPVSICADESCHTRADLPRLIGRYSHINVKLDKTGGLTEAVALMREATAAGLKLMVGCMVSTSLSIGPAMLLAQFAEIVDLDGPLLLARDRSPSLNYEGEIVHPPSRELWG
jgi:L-alanine-DL-glutamate epimerase-like enolase superfamily enzyme